MKFCCVDSCRTLIVSGSRCAEHRTQWNRARDARRGTREQRGYGSAWLSIRKAVLAQDDRCRYCGKPATEVDHVVPKSKGGTDSFLNLVPACKPCNSGKRDQ